MSAQIPQIPQIPMAREPERRAALWPDSRFDLVAQARALWNHRILIVAATLVLGAVGASFSLLGPTEYEASATASLGTPSGGRPVGYADSFVNVLRSQAIADRIVDEFKLAQLNPPVTSSVFLTDVLSVREMPQTSIVQIAVRMRDPVLAGKVVSRVTQLGVEAGRQVAQSEIAASERELKDALDRAEGGMREAEDAYTTFAGTAQVELLKADVDAWLAQRVRSRALAFQIEAERARLATAERDLQARSPTTLTTQSLDSNPALMEAARQAAPDRSPLGLQMKEERPDDVYKQLDAVVALTRANVAALERERDELQARAGADNASSKQISELHEKQTQLERLDLDRRLARKSYEDIAAKYQTTRLTILDRTPQYLIVDPGHGDGLPVSRYLTRNVFLGLVAGALFGIMIALARFALAPDPY